MSARQHHPDHDRLAEEVRRWYSASYAQMGYIAESRQFGIYSRNVRAPERTRRVTVGDLLPEQVPDFTLDLRGFYGPGTVYISMESPKLDAALSQALQAAGFVPDRTEVFLAHVGPVPQSPAMAALAIRAVTQSALSEFAITKIKGFSSSEQEPTAGEVESEMALRQAELAGDGRFLLARVEDAPAGIIGWYEGPDRFIFILATRVPFRGRGIARALLCHVLVDSYAQGCRSVIINADPADTPIQLYCALGFVDEIYWRKVYRVDLPPTH